MSTKSQISKARTLYEAQYAYEPLWEANYVKK